MSYSPPILSSDERKPVGLRVVASDETSPYPKCSLVLRGLARLVDVAVAWGIALAAGRPGPLLALLFVLLADGVFQGQSPGKRIFGVRALYLPARSPVRYRESVLRNAPFGLIALLRMMPPPLGFKAFLAGILVIGGVETWRVLRDPLGLRLGDNWAFTQVIDAKVSAGAGAVASVVQPMREPGLPGS